jgi:DNA-binding response OmpR family regulator
MLTAKSDSTSKVIGLEIGADDYLTKPFDPSELIARIRALLRRATEYGPISSEKLIVGELVIDLSARQVISKRPIELTLKEFELLAHLAKNLGRVVTRSALFEHSWGYDLSFDSNSLDVHIYRLRRKIEPDPSKPRYLHTVKGYGYKLADLAPG